MTKTPIRPSQPSQTSDTITNPNTNHTPSTTTMTSQSDLPIKTANERQAPQVDPELVEEVLKYLSLRPDKKADEKAEEENHESPPQSLAGYYMRPSPKLRRFAPPDQEYLDPRKQSKGKAPATSPPPAAAGEPANDDEQAVPPTVATPRRPAPSQDEDQANFPLHGALEPAQMSQSSRWVEGKHKAGFAGGNAGANYSKSPKAYAPLPQAEQETQQPAELANRTAMSEFDLTFLDYYLRPALGYPMPSPGAFHNGEPILELGALTAWEQVERTRHPHPSKHTLEVLGVESNEPRRYLFHVDRWVLEQRLPVLEDARQDLQRRWPGSYALRIEAPARVVNACLEWAYKGHYTEPAPLEKLPFLRGLFSLACRWQLHTLANDCAYQYLSTAAHLPREALPLLVDEWKRANTTFMPHPNYVFLIKLMVKMRGVDLLLDKDCLSLLESPGNTDLRNLADTVKQQLRQSRVMPTPGSYDYTRVGAGYEVMRLYDDLHSAFLGLPHTLTDTAGYVTPYRPSAFLGTSSTYGLRRTAPGQFGVPAYPDTE